MRKAFRFTFSQEEHSDIIKTIERCPKPLRSELIAIAIRVLEKNKHIILVGKQDDNPVKQEVQTSNINISDVFNL